VIRKDKKGNFWIGTNNGLNYFQPKTGEFKRIYSKMARMYPRKLINQIEALALTESKVAGIINVTDYQDLSRDFEINKPGKYLVMAVGENYEGTLADFGWIEKNANDTIWSSANFQKTYYAGGAAKNRILINQISLTQGKYKLRYHSDDSHSYNNWNEAAPDQTSLYGIVLIDITGTSLEESMLALETENKEQQNISGINITAIALAKDHVWVGTDPDGLNRIDLISNEVKTFKNDPGNIKSISSNTIFDVYEDETGIVWITTDAGINRFDPITEHFMRFTEEDGLTTNLTESILPGDNGEMWVSTQSGLSQMVPGKLPGKFTFINYNADDGLGGDTFLAQAATRTADGKFYFGGDHGLNALSKISANNIPPDLIFSNLLISNKSVYDMGDKSPLNGDLLDQKEIHLTYDQNNLSFEFSALHYANQHKNQYAHLLKGYDKGWVYDNHNYASYTNLDPGKYDFIIRASNAYGVWNENGKSIQIIISPPWWRTWWAYGAFALLFAMGLFGFDRFMRRRLILRERERSRELELAQAKEIEMAYTNLKTTQSQLIQAEKMASLGELTAGIAHEIQNPLNFVNNFSEINTELIQEMKDEIEKGNMDEVKAIANDIAENEQKIAHHGKRADAIVKGMLQHSRSSSGIKEPTDINALADEYLRLAYHGLRAKDKSFNASMKTDFDETIGNINVVPQDIGRVILNLITNAFYAVQVETRHALSLQYQPTVSVSTKKDGNTISISVKDNGPGIPEYIIDKIFQPFFTTKPTGEGTGLGLSLSYDIVKAHGGELKVETKEGEGTLFTIKIPA
jgi:signal transduction histidine kinase